MIIKVSPLADAPGRFLAQLGDRVLVASSRQPFLDAARVLLADGCDPATVIVMRHAASDFDALRSTVGFAAGLVVEDVYFRPRPGLVNASPVDFDGGLLTGAQGTARTP
jgi:hypothetical protein